MNSEFLSFLGIARKSGSLILGMDEVKNNIKRLSLILVVKDISESSLKKINNIASKNKVKVLKLEYAIEDINKSIGKAVAIIGISNQNFVNKLVSIMEKSKCN